MHGCLMCSSRTLSYCKLAPPLTCILHRRRGSGGVYQRREAGGGRSVHRRVAARAGGGAGGWSAAAARLRAWAPARRIWRMGHAGRRPAARHILREFWPSKQARQRLPHCDGLSRGSGLHLGSRDFNFQVHILHPSVSMKLGSLSVSIQGDTFSLVLTHTRRLRPFAIGWRCARRGAARRRRRGCRPPGPLGPLRRHRKCCPVPCAAAGRAAGPAVASGQPVCGRVAAQRR